MRTYNKLLHGLRSKTVQIIISVQKDSEGCLLNTWFVIFLYSSLARICNFIFCQILKYHFKLSGPMFISGLVEGVNPE